MGLMRHDRSAGISALAEALYDEFDDVDGLLEFVSKNLASHDRKRVQERLRDAADECDDYESFVDAATELIADHIDEDFFDKLQRRVGTVVGHRIRKFWGE